MDLRKERTLKLLSESLIALLHEKAYSSITVSEICENAMVRRATFYRHFSGKDALLAYAISSRRAKADAQVDPGGTLPLPDYCHMMTAEFLRLVSEHRTEIQSRAFSPEFAFVKDLLAKELGERFAQKLADRTGESASEKRLQELGAFYAHGLVGAVEKHAENRGDSDEGEFLAFVDDIAQRLFK